MGRIIITTITLLLSFGISYSQSVNDTSFALLPGEGWWGGAVAFGSKMPLGSENFSFNLNGDKSYNQSVPMLLSNRGRWVWSNEAFRYTFRNDSLIIDSTYARVSIGQNGSSLKEVYQYASGKFFPPSGRWVDKKLITSPQYNLWIELSINPNQADVLKYANHVIANGLPTGVLMIDGDWNTNKTVFDFDTARFPDAKYMISDLHSKGFKVMIWISPFIAEGSKEYIQLSGEKMLLLHNEGDDSIGWDSVEKPLMIEWWGGRSACLDLTNPKTVRWLNKKLSYLRKKYGIDGFKLDGGDAYFYTDPALVSYRKVHPNHHTVKWAEVGLEYPLNEYRAMWKMAGTPLVHRLSDKDHSWQALQALVPETIAQQLAGYQFTCPDMIGGGNIASFEEPLQIDQELVVRSAQCHALMPMMQFSAAPWRILDETHQKAVYKAVAIRQRYVPYILRTMEYAVRTGMPAVKPLEFDYPGQGYENVKDQFLLGDSLMIAPIVTKKNTRTVIFPTGSWRYNDHVFHGPSEKEFKVALDELLIFERGPAVPGKK